MVLEGDPEWLFREKGWSFKRREHKYNRVVVKTKNFKQNFYMAEQNSCGNLCIHMIVTIRDGRAEIIYK